MSNIPLHPNKSRTSAKGLNDMGALLEKNRALKAAGEDGELDLRCGCENGKNGFQGKPKKKQKGYRTSQGILICDATDSVFH